MTDLTSEQMEILKQHGPPRISGIGDISLEGKDDLRAGIAKHKWWHSIELAPGVVTPGKAHNQFLLNLLDLPDDLSGKTVLDIGCWDGYFSFECEKRGAEVTSCDVWETAGRGAFDFAREALGSKVHVIQESVMDLNPELDGRFDLVLFLGVLYHLEDPLGGMKIVASMTKPGGTAVIDTVVDVKSLFERPSLAFYAGAELNNDATNWFVPNMQGLTTMMSAAGFKTAESVVQLYGGDRTIMRGIKRSDEEYAQLQELYRQSRFSWEV